MIDYAFSYENLELYLLVLMRVASFVYVAPFFSMSNTPQHLRIGLSIFISLILYNVIPHDGVSYQGLLGYSVLVLKEVVTGLIIGLGANLCLLIVNFAGQIADMETGLSMVSLFDPNTKDNVTITGAYYNYMMFLILIISGMHHYLISALAETYQLIPVNGQVFQMDELLNGILEFLGDYVIIGFRICLPIFATMILLNAILGILAKVSPQMNMFAVGIQIKVLTGLGILFVTVAMLPSATGYVYEQMKHIVVLMVEAMS